MNKNEALEKIKNSLARGAQVITPKGQIYSEYVEKKSQSLLENVIEPIKANIISASFPEYDFEKYKNTEVWAIARHKDNWLLTLAGENEFALGFGKTEKEINMHGFSSSDALGEWLS